MLEYLNFSLLCAIFALLLYLYFRVKRYLTILKMVDEINLVNLGYELSDLRDNSKRQKLLECVLTGNSKLYLGKVYTKEQIEKLSEEEVEKLFNNYEAKLSGQMVKSLGSSIINMYSMGACSVLGISDKNALSKDLENDPFLNSALQRLTFELYYRFGSFLAPLSVGLITSKHYLCEYNINGERTSENGERTSENGERTSGNGERTSENGERTSGNDREKEPIVNG